MSDDLKKQGMQEDKKEDTKGNVSEDKAQKGNEIKSDLPIKNAMTDAAKNAANHTPGLNQENTTRDDLFPSDGDNLTAQ